MLGLFRWWKSRIWRTLQCKCRSVPVYKGRAPTPIHALEHRCKTFYFSVGGRVPLFENHCSRLLSLHPQCTSAICYFFLRQATYWILVSNGSSIKYEMCISPLRWQSGTSWTFHVYLQLHIWLTLLNCAEDINVFGWSDTVLLLSNVHYYRCIPSMLPEPTQTVRLRSFYNVLTCCA